MGSSQKLKPLPKLTKRLEFQSLSKDGVRVYGGHLVLANFKGNELGYLRCGWTIPRYVGSAVTRNRLRRWCREFFRANLNSGWNPSIDMNIVIRKKEKNFYKGLEFNDFKKSLSLLQNKVEKRLHE